MAGTSSNSTQGQQSALATLCKAWLVGLGVVWGMILLPIVVSVIANVVVLPKAWADVLKKPIEWIFQNPFLTLLLLVILALMTWIVFLYSRQRPTPITPTPAQAPSAPVQVLPTPVYLTAPPASDVQPTQQARNEQEVKERYLQRMMRKTERLNLEGGCGSSTCTKCIIR